MPDPPCCPNLNENVVSLTCVATTEQQGSRERFRQACYVILLHAETAVLSSSTLNQAADGMQYEEVKTSFFIDSMHLLRLLICSAQASLGT